MAGAEAQPRSFTLTLYLGAALAGAVVVCAIGLGGWTSHTPKPRTYLASEAPNGVTIVYEAAKRRNSPLFERLWAAAGGNGPGAAPVSTELLSVAAPVVAEAQPAIVQPAAYFAWADEPVTASAVPFEAIFKIPADDVANAVPAPAKRPAIAASEEECMATAIYFEARGESREGQMAVAQVILNRVKSPAYPKSVCGVVYEGSGHRRGCQFSFTCDGVADRINDRNAWRTAKSIAEKALTDPDGVLVADIGNATNYHASFVSPRWSDKMKMVDVIGQHVFYAASRS